MKTFVIVANEIVNICQVGGNMWDSRIKNGKSMPLCMLVIVRLDTTESGRMRERARETRTREMI